MKFFRWCARFLLLTMAFVVYAQQPAAAAELVKTVTLPPAPPLLSPALCGKSTLQGRENPELEEQRRMLRTIAERT